MPTNSCQWRTVFSSRSSVQLSWPVNAQSAQLTVSDGTKSAVYALSAGMENFDGWHDALPTETKDEQSLSFAIDYYTGSVVGGVVSGSQIVGASRSVAGVGLVRGTDNASFAAKLMSAESKKWASTNLRIAVVPTPADATRLTVGETVHNLDGIPSWRSLAFARKGTYPVALSDESGEIMSIDLTYLGLGLCFLIH